MDDLIFIFASVEGFQSVGVDTSGLRKTIDGTKALIHIQYISDEQILSLVKKGDLQSLTHEGALKATHTKEWEGEEKEH